MRVWSVSGPPEGQACQASSVLPSSFPSRAWAQLGRPAPSDTLPLLEDALWGPQSESLLGFGSELNSPELAKATSMGSGIGIRM